MIITRNSHVLSCSDVWRELENVVVDGSIDDEFCAWINGDEILSDVDFNAVSNVEEFGSFF